MTQDGIHFTHHDFKHGAHFNAPRASSTSATMTSTIRQGQRLESDPDLSDEDANPAGPRLSREEVESAVGVSIGREQLRLKSPFTPAAERSKALEDSEHFPGFTTDDATADHVHDLVTEPAGAEPGKEAPTIQTTKWQLEELAHAGEKENGQTQAFTRSDASRSFLRDSIGAPRRRSSSGPMAVAENLRRLFSEMPSLSLPKSPNLPSFGLSQRSKMLDTRQRESTSNLARGQQLSLPSPWQSRVHSPPNKTRDQQNSSPGLISRPPEVLRARSRTATAFDGTARSTSSDSRPTPSLRRVASDNSLYMRRTLSHSSTIDSQKFESVQEQVNSRFKAIKDSFQDSALRNLPKMPNVDLSSFKPSFISRIENESDKETYPQAGDRHTLHTTAQKNSSANSGGMKHAVEPEKLTYPSLARALPELEGDVLVLGGYRGSILRSAEPPHRQLWVPVKVGLNIRKVDLEVGLNDEDELKMEESIIPSGTLSHIGPVDICRRLLRKLHKSPNAKSGALRVHDYGYDWRLSPKLLVCKLIDYIEKLPCNGPGTAKENRGVTVIAHSLGGLLVRSAVNIRPDLFAGVIYAGVPQHCVNILGPLRNGDDVLFSSRVLTAQVNFTLRTSFALLPETGVCFFNGKTKERYDVDFFDANTWEEYRLSPCLRPPLPPFNPQEQRKSLFDTVSDSIASLPKRASFAMSRDASPQRRPSPTRKIRRAAEQLEDSALEPTMNSPPPQGSTDASQNFANSVKTRVTLPHDAAHEYLKRTLSSVIEFKRSTSFRPEHQASNIYPPAAVLYGKTIPTVFGARVASREAIKHADAYDNLAFAPGDGVVLFKAAMLPPGYRVVRDGLVQSERGHVGLLGDLEGVGKCLLAIIGGRKRGIGLEGSVG